MYRIEWICRMVRPWWLCEAPRRATGDDPSLTAILFIPLILSVL